MQQMAGYPLPAGTPWTAYPQNGGSEQFPDMSYRSQELSPWEHEERRLGSLNKDHKAVSHHRVHSAPGQRLGPMELEGEAPRAVHEIGEGNGGVAK